jgi:hypothetical protein
MFNFVRAEGLGMKYDRVGIVVEEIHHAHDKSSNSSPLSQFTSTYFNGGSQNK